MKILIAGLGSIGAEIAFTFYPSADITCIDHGKHFETIRKILPKINFVKGDIHDLSLLNNIPGFKILLLVLRTLSFFILDNFI